MAIYGHIWLHIWPYICQIHRGPKGLPSTKKWRKTPIGHVHRVRSCRSVLSSNNQAEFGDKITSKYHASWTDGNCYVWYTKMAITDGNDNHQQIPCNCAWFLNSPSQISQYQSSSAISRHFEPPWFVILRDSLRTPENSRKVVLKWPHIFFQPIDMNVYWYVQQFY